MNGASPRSISRAFAEEVGAIVKLHRLSLEGRFESPEAEAIRDSADEPWHEMSSADRKRVFDLSVDLNALEENLHAPEAPALDARELQEAYEAKQAGDFDRALDIIRAADPRAASAVALFFRGGIWHAIGFPEVAWLFFRRASSLDRGNDAYLAATLSSLSGFDREGAFREAETILAGAETSGVRTAFAASGIAFEETLTLDPDDRAARRRALAAPLEILVRRLESTPIGKGEALATVLMTLATCLHESGDRKGAFESISRAISIDPDSSDLLVARGRMTFGTSRFDVSDLERAVALGAREEWPYAFLAMRYFEGRRFEQMRSVCEQGLRIAENVATKSELTNLRAIAEAELGFSSGLVVRSFEEAIRLDPSNLFAKENLDAYLQVSSLESTRPSAWVRPTEQSLVPAA